MKRESVTSATSLDELFTRAVSEISNVVSGERILVKELFLGYEWNRIEKGNRTRLGSMFYRYAQNQGSDLLLPIEKTPQNQQKYLKK